MNASYPSNINGLFDESGRAADKATSSFKLLKAYWSSGADAALEDETMEILMFRARDDVDSLANIISHFPDNNCLILPGFKECLVDEIEPVLNDSCNMLGVLADCYSGSKQMPFSRHILASVMDELISNVSGVVACVASYCQNIEGKS
jgi:hypothetical protein